MTHKDLVWWGAGSPNHKKLARRNPGVVGGPSHGRKEFAEKTDFPVPEACYPPGTSRHMKKRIQRQSASYVHIAALRNQLYDIVVEKRYDQATINSKVKKLYIEIFELERAAQKEVKAIEKDGGVPFPVPAHFKEMLRFP